MKYTIIQELSIIINFLSINCFYFYFRFHYHYFCLSAPINQITIVIIFIIVSVFHYFVIAINTLMKFLIIVLYLLRGLA